jgi:pimeloyl-ACP methyl ester carboxylesterase
MSTSRNGTGVEDLNMLSVRVVHGFAVAGFVFKPLTARLRRQSLDAKLFRYPSVGLSLNEIIDRVAKNLIDDPPRGIIAHSLGCVATLQAIHRISWTGPIVLLAPPIKTLPLTRFVPTLMRCPFAPLIDHREWTSVDGQSISAPPQCPTMTIAGRVDMTVPRSCTHLNDAQ